MKQRITILFLLAGLVAVLAGCGESFNVKKGEQVRFTVFTNSEPGTKTEYAGYVAGSGFERIRWSVGDNIRIFSTNTEIVRAKWADNRDVADYYDYKISSRKDSLERYCKGTLTWAEEGAGEGYGLVWVNDPYNVSLYGVYPSATPQYDQNDATKIVAFQGMTIPESQSATLDMSHAYMVSAPSEFKESGYVDEHGQSIPSMEMEFYPFFNAFDIEFQTLDGGSFIVNSVSLSSSVNGLSGDYKYLITENSGAPTVANVTYNQGSSSNVTNSVTADLTSLSEANRTVSSTHPVRVTLLTLPPTSSYSTGLTNMTLTINYNDNKTKSLKLNNNVTVVNGVQTDEGTPIKFKPFYKSRINGLALNGFPDNIEFKFVVQPWDKTEISINSATGSINMSNVTWMNTKVDLDGNGIFGEGEENSDFYENTVNNYKYKQTVTMFYNPTIEGSQGGTSYSGYYPAQGYFTVNYPSSGKYKIGLIPAYGETTVDPSKYEIYIYKRTGTDSNNQPVYEWVAHDQTNGEDISNDTVYFQIRAASPQDGAQHKAQIDIWFCTNPTAAEPEWVSAYSEIRANYALVIPAVTNSGN